MQKAIIVFFMLIFSGTSFSQWKGADNQRSGNMFGKNRRDAIWSHSNSHYRALGWHINPGITYMVGNSASDESDAYDLTPSGLPGYYVEAGMEHLFKKIHKAFHYIDWGIGVKHFGGQEKLDLAGNKTRGQFNFGNVFGRGAIHNVWQLSMHNFIDQSIGVNVDYRIYGGKEDADYAPPAGYDNQSKLVAQLHYSFGWGIKVRDGFYIVPQVQTPILTAFNWNGFNPSHKWFNSRYQPTIFTIKFAWLFAKKGCNVPDDARQKDANENFLNN
ncbi:MAG: hypothetical protein ACI857_000858 [Arenicella sp.]|jgi:hypothetical protein